MNVTNLFNKWMNDEQTEEEFNEDLQSAFAKVDGHEVSVHWTPDMGLCSFGPIWVDGVFYDIEGNRLDSTPSNTL